MRKISQEYLNKHNVLSNTTLGFEKFQNSEIPKFQKRYNAFVNSTVFPQFSSRRYQSLPVSPFDWSRIGQKNSVLFFSQLVGVSIGSDISGIPTRNTASIVGEKKAITCWTIRINDPFVAFNVVGTEGPRIYINSSRKLIASVRHRPTDLTSCRLPYSFHLFPPLLCQ